MLYERLEEHLRHLVRAEAVLALPTLSHMHRAVIPLLAAEGEIFLDARAHRTMYEGCLAARGNGATLHRFAHNDAQDLERLLRACTGQPKVT